MNDLRDGREGRDDDVVLRSRDIAAIAGTTPRALRHYHATGLLPDVPRDPNGYRRYSVRELVLVLRIRQLAASGMPLRRVRGLLEEDSRRQDESLAELDRNLAEQAERIGVQREMLARVRQQTRSGTWTGSGTGVKATEQFDRDVWTLASATGGIEPDDAAAVLEALESGPLASQAIAVAGEFEQLAEQSQIDSDEADRLVEGMLKFGYRVLETVGVEPCEGEQPVAALIRGMSSDSLSPAQQVVWEKFLVRLAG